MTVALALPVLPVAHARVLSILRQPVPSLSEVVLLVESDPALTASVLRTANSAASAPLTRIATANNAIVRIGLSMTRRILAGAVLKETFRGSGRSGIDADELWRHLILTALLSEGVSADAGARSAAFTAGLLHDVGRLAMAASEPHGYRAVVDRAAGGANVSAAEREVFGVAHVEWGTEVARAWDFPREVVEAIEQHHRAESSSALAERMRHAREAAWRLGAGDGIAPGRPRARGGRRARGAARRLRRTRRALQASRVVSGRAARARVRLQAHRGHTRRSAR